jgi:hypothetical protein
VIEWIATDEFQNSNSVKQNVEIVDKKAPKVDCDKLIKNIEITESEIAAGICVDND